MVHVADRRRSPPVELAEYLGIRPNWVDSTGHGGSIWEFMVEHAAAAIAQGLGEVVVLTYGSTQRADLKKKLRMANLSFGTTRPDPVRGALRAPRRLPLRHGGPPSHARVRHDHGAALRGRGVGPLLARGSTPEAYYRDPITIDDVMNSGHRCGTQAGPSSTVASAPTAGAPSCLHQRGAGQGLRQSTRVGPRNRRRRSPTPR